MKPIYLTIFCFFLCIGNFAQSPTNLPSMIPPSPNAQTFSKYGEFPVSHYTGVPNIDIPIYTISLKDISIPITISYNSSGIRVEEESSRIGLGWIINVGGVITRTIYGNFNDFNGNVYFNNTPYGDNHGNKLADLTDIYRFDKYTLGTYTSKLPFSLSGMSKLDLYNSFSNNISCGGIEMSPDIMSYNFMGYSGKFIFSHSGKIIKEKQDNIQIKPLRKNNHIEEEPYGYILITPDGNKYRFEQTEKAMPNNLGGAVISYYCSYYLTSIETVNGSIVYFTYKKQGNFYGIYNRCFNGSSEEAVINYANYEVTYLDKIIFPNGEIHFNYKFDREDYSPEPRLYNVDINIKGNDSYRCFFEHEYFISNTNNTEKPTLERLQYIMNNKASYYNESWNKKRLKLKGIRFIGANNEQQTYEFFYNEMVLPTKLSLSQDHWGYYNGTNNNTLIPVFGANRTAVELLNQAFILEKIVFPTGGKTEFTYQTNKYKTNVLENDPYKADYYSSPQKTLLEEGVGWNNVPIEHEHTVPLKLPYNGESYRTTFNVRIKITLDDSYNRRVGEKALYLSVENSSSKPWSFVYQAPYLPQSVDDSNRTYTKTWGNIPAATGEYVLKVYGSLRTYCKQVELEVTRSGSAEEYYKEHPFELGGGLRVKKIINFESDKFASGKKYAYTEDGMESDFYSTGKLMFYPRYRKSFDMWGSNGLRGDGYSVGYSKVTVYNIDPSGAELDKSIYNYINIPDKNLYYTWEDILSSGEVGRSVKDENPNGINGFKYSENGTLLSEYIYSGKPGSLYTIFTLLKSIIYTYSGLGDGPYIVWGIAKSPYNSPNSGCLYDFSNSYLNSLASTDLPAGYLYPVIRPIHMALSKKEEIEKGILTETKYTHNSNFYVTKKIISVQGEKIKAEECTYASDLANDAMMKELTVANRIDHPIITKQTKGKDSLIFVNSYRKDEGNIILSSISSNTALNREMETRIIYHNYDSFNNPIFISKDDINKLVYLWGYKGQHLIASIQNASYEEVKESLGVNPESLSLLEIPDMNSVNSLRTKLKNALITTYTYIPSIGVTTETLPNGEIEYYEYDAFGRLVSVKNNNKKIVKQFRYKYYNQSAEVEPEPDKYCNVTFDTSGLGGDGSIKTVKMKYGEPLPTPTPAQGYSFEGWYDGNTKITTVPNSPNRTITGKFKLIKYIAVGDNSYIISPTKTQQVGTNNWKAIAFGNGKYIAVGENGYVTSSRDDENWTTPKQIGIDNWRAVTYGNGKYIAVGENGYVTSSSDGENWTTPKQVRTSIWYGITYGNGKFVMVGSSGYISTSTDGENWTTPKQVGTSHWYGITYVDGMFVIVGNSGYISTSTDGINWTTPKRVGTSHLWAAIYVDGMFVIVGDSGYISTSTDGINWSKETVKDNNGQNISLNSICEIP